jgi:hypothetical protein
VRPPPSRAEAVTGQPRRSKRMSQLWRSLLVRTAAPFAVPTITATPIYFSPLVHRENKPLGARLSNVSPEYIWPVLRLALDAGALDADV